MTLFNRRTMSSHLTGLLGVAVVAASGAFVAIAITPAAAAPQPSTTLRAERLELVDKSGLVRAQLHVEENGEVIFRMRDQQGQIRLKLGASGNGSGLILLDDQTETGIQMLAGISALTNKPDTHVTLTDQRGTVHTIRPAN